MKDNKKASKDAKKAAEGGLVPSKPVARGHIVGPRAHRRRPSRRTLRPASSLGRLAILPGITCTPEYSTVQYSVLGGRRNNSQGDHAGMASTFPVGRLCSGNSGNVCHADWGT